MSGVADPHQDPDLRSLTPKAAHPSRRPCFRAVLPQTDPDMPTDTAGGLRKHKDIHSACTWAALAGISQVAGPSFMITPEYRQSHSRGPFAHLSYGMSGGGGNRQRLCGRKIVRPPHRVLLRYRRSGFTLPGLRP
jgi:hypothetical protein